MILDSMGKLVEKNDDDRIIWFSIHCSYWTDDFSKLKLTFPNGIPVCPNCKSLGFQTKYKDWERSAKRYESNDHPRYWEFILSIKEKCVTKMNGKPVSVKLVYKKWLDQMNSGQKSISNALNDGIKKIDG